MVPNIFFNALSQILNFNTRKSTRPVHISDLLQNNEPIILANVNIYSVSNNKILVHLNSCYIPGTAEYDEHHQDDYSVSI